MKPALQSAPVTVNGRVITSQLIDEEVQYHPAASFPEAREKAAQALVIRELLRLEATGKGLLKDAANDEDERDGINALLEEEIVIPEPDRETCERYYNSNRRRFITPPLFEVSHILFLAPPEDEQAREQAKAKADETLSFLQKDPSRFADIARERSACSSAKDGGRLGQISKGQTTPEFEKALFQMQKGDISRAPVLTPHGYHIIQVHEKVDGRELPFEAVHESIRDYLKLNAWRRAVSQYISLLAGKADIKGVHLDGADTPLVQ